MGLEGGRSGSPTQAVRQLKYYAILGQTCTLHRKKKLPGRCLANGALCLSTPEQNGKSGTGLFNQLAIIACIIEIHMVSCVSAISFRSFMVGEKRIRSKATLLESKKKSVDDPIIRRILTVSFFLRLNNFLSAMHIEFADNMIFKLCLVNVF